MPTLPRARRLRSPTIERLLELAQQAARDALRVAGVGDRDDETELVAAETRDRVARPERQLQAARDLDEEAVALLVAEGVVDLLEAVEVEQHHGELVAGPRRAADRVLGPVVEEHAVREARQTVVERDLLGGGHLGAKPAHEPAHAQVEARRRARRRRRDDRSASPPASATIRGSRQTRGQARSRAQFSSRLPENAAGRMYPVSAARSPGLSAYDALSETSRAFVTSMPMAVKICASDDALALLQVWPLGGFRQ